MLLQIHQLRTHFIHSTPHGHTHRHPASHNPPGLHMLNLAVSRSATKRPLSPLPYTPHVVYTCCLFLSPPSLYHIRPEHIHGAPVLLLTGLTGRLTTPLSTTSTCQVMELTMHLLWPACKSLRGNPAAPHANTTTSRYCCTTQPTSTTAVRQVVDRQHDSGTVRKCLAGPMLLLLQLMT